MERIRERTVQYRVLPAHPHSDRSPHAVGTQKHSRSARHHGRSHSHYQRQDSRRYLRTFQSSYRSRWFCVLKKDGLSLRIVHDLQPLNAVTIRDTAVPPMTEQLAESFGGHACYGSLDLFVSFDQRLVHPDSRDFMTFQSPLGTLRLTRIAMGYTNSPQILHGDTTYIL
jgi:hypothetical protein